MFVSSMTFEEIRQEMDKEKGSLVNKIKTHIIQIHKLMRKYNMHTLDKEYEYISKRKNRWVYRVHNDKSNKDYIWYDLYCLYYTQRSYAVVIYNVEENTVNYYTSHFFTRYFQREGLDREDVKEIIRTFFSRSAKGAYQPLKQVSDDVWQIFNQTENGVALGYRHDKLNLFEYRTFINNSMLKGSQIEMSKQLAEKFNFHVVRKTPGEGDTQSLSG